MIRQCLYFRLRQDAGCPVYKIQKWLSNSAQETRVIKIVAWMASATIRARQNLR